RYSDDLELPNQCWLVLLRSPHAHARLGAIDLAEVKKAPGVIGVWTMAELRADGVGQIPFPPLFKRADGSPMAAPARTPLAESELHNQRVIAMALEPRACIGVHEGARTTLYTQNQTPTGARELLGVVFRAKPEEFRIVVGDIGGGFGMKTGLTPEDALVCHAARKLARPVKWRADRAEDFLAAHMGRDQHNKARLALDAQGKILALEVDTLGNIGA